jgi:hypothetical protein
MEDTAKMSMFPFLKSGHATTIRPEAGSTSIEGIGICHAPIETAEPATLFSRTSGPHVTPPSRERSKRMSSERYDHHVARTVPSGATLTIPPRLPPASATRRFGVQLAPPSFDRANARSCRVAPSEFQTQYRFPAASCAALSLSAKFGASS